MSANLNPYLNFDGTTAEAMEHYRSVFGGELTVNTYASFGMGGPDEADKIMHSQLEIPGGMVLMAADAPGDTAVERGNASAISLSGGPAEADELRAWFTGLSEGGTVGQPLEQAPWGDSFGMCFDRYGIQWMVNIGGA